MLKHLIGEKDQRKMTRLISADRKSIVIQKRKASQDTRRTLRSMG